ncbi:hypothetical protein BVY03_05815 [bacterium K02(2017)]|nr:hypothetical protein BVY03_05815 [bacterium K02(2017)]
MIVFGMKGLMKSLIYPEDSLQNLIGDWWLTKENNTEPLARGDLIWAHLPHIDQVPKELIITNRSDPTSHTRAEAEIRSINCQSNKQQLDIPVAAFPCIEGEIYTVHRSKMRPCVVVSIGGSNVNSLRTTGQAKYQTSKTLLVAPYYGTKGGTSRGGWPDILLERSRHCEYPQYMWDILPVNKNIISILRFDHIQPLSTLKGVSRRTNYSLSQNALKIFDSWLVWLFSNYLKPDSDLDQIRNLLLSLE